jgi:hypothetical protein
MIYRYNPVNSVNPVELSFAGSACLHSPTEDGASAEREGAPAKRHVSFW